MGWEPEGIYLRARKLLWEAVLSTSLAGCIASIGVVGGIGITGLRVQVRLFDYECGWFGCRHQVARSGGIAG